MASALTAVQPKSDPGEHPAQRLLLRFKGALTGIQTIISASTVVTLYRGPVSKSIVPVLRLSLLHGSYGTGKERSGRQVKTSPS